MIDTLPAGARFRGATAPGWECGRSGQVLTCKRGNLPSGASAPITIRVVAPGVAGTIENTATVQTTVVGVHDMAVLKIGGEMDPVKFTNKVSSVTRRVKVRVENRSPYPETIQSPAMLQSLVNLTVDSLGACPDLVPVLVTGRRRRRFRSR